MILWCKPTRRLPKSLVWPMPAKRAMPAMPWSLIWTRMRAVGCGSRWTRAKQPPSCQLRNPPPRHGKRNSKSHKTQWKAGWRGQKSWWLSINTTRPRPHCVWPFCSRAVRSIRRCRCWNSSWIPWRTTRAPWPAGRTSIAGRESTRQCKCCWRWLQYSQVIRPWQPSCCRIPAGRVWLKRGRSLPNKRFARAKSMRPRSRHDAPVKLEHQRLCWLK